MPAERRKGMDHEHYDWSPIVNRGTLRWPENAPVALCVVVNLEHLEWRAPERSHTFRPAGGLGPRPFPSYELFSHREYGHRVGIFRVLDALEMHGIKATVAMDALTAENYPYLVEHCRKRGCEIIGHGISLSRAITSKMPEQEERDYIKTSLDALKRATGSAPLGWLGPEYGESARTPQLLAEAGVRYVCDWTNDEQPYPMNISKGRGELLALPMMWELDDAFALSERRVPVDRYGQLIKESFDTLAEDGAKNGRLLALNLHPWLIGQPFRIGYLEEALGHIASSRAVWPATGSEIVDWYRSHPPG